MSKPIQLWAKEMMDFLLTAKEAKARADGQLSAEQLVHFEKNLIGFSHKANN